MDALRLPFTIVESMENQGNRDYVAPLRPRQPSRRDHSHCGKEMLIWHLEILDRKTTTPRLQYAKTKFETYKWLVYFLPRFSDRANMSGSDSFVLRDEKFALRSPTS